MRFLYRDRGPERGITIVEVGVAMFITALLATVMITWLTGVYGAESRQASYDEALGDLRDVSDRMARDVRGASEIVVADPDTITFWLDADRDGVTDLGEVVTWAIVTDGTVVRSTDGGLSNAVIATNIVPGSSGFSYDDPVAADISVVTISLAAAADLGPGAGTDEVVHSTDVHLRNG